MKLDQALVESLKSRNVESLFAKESFADSANYRNSFQEIKDLLLQIVDAVSDIDLPYSFGNNYNQFITRWLSLCNRIESYKMVEDAQRQLREKNAILQEIDNWHSSIPNGFMRDPDNKIIPYNFLQLHNWAINNKKSFEKEKADFNNMLSELKNKNDFGEARDQIKSLINEVAQSAKDAKSIVDELRLSAAAQTFKEYANIFKNEAERYSTYKIGKLWNPFTIRLGASEIWLVSGIIFSLLFAGVIISGKFETLFPIDTGKESISLISQVLTRLLVISIWIYLITFSFRQFSINRHLATVNKHRANALNSYNLFTESIDKADTASRNALMLNVAKAIYEQSQTGYLATASRESASIVEITKLINGQAK